eukprot:scaffold18830_cov77-Isochrysis_galbana.AAC.2
MSAAGESRGRAAAARDQRRSNREGWRASRPQAQAFARMPLPHSSWKAGGHVGRAECGSPVQQHATPGAPPKDDRAAVVDSREAIHSPSSPRMSIVASAAAAVAAEETSIVASAAVADAPCLDLIVPGLAVGNEAAAHDRELLKSRNVVAVLNVTRTDSPWAHLLRKRRIAYMQVGVDDRRTEELYPFFEECCAFISRHRAQALEAAAAAQQTGAAADALECRVARDSGTAGGGSACAAPCVLVHCHQGTSRSVTVLMAYLMRSLNPHPQP